MKSSFLTRDQALRLWSGSTDSKTLDYQRTNPREHQTVRIHTQEATWIQDLLSPNHQSPPVQMPHLNNKQNKNTNPIISRQDYTSLSLAHQRKNKQTNRNSAKISPYTKLTQTTGPTLKVKVKSLSHARLFMTPWTGAHKAPLSMGFSRQKYWSGLPFPSQRILPTQGSNPGLPHRRWCFTVWAIREATKKFLKKGRKKDTG